MSDTSETPTPTGEEAPDPGALRERGDKAEAKAKTLEGENETLRRELAFTTAGIPGEGVGALFRKAYDGELDAESISEAMTTYGIEAPTTAVPETAVPPEGAGVVETIAPGMALPPAAQTDPQNEMIQQMQEITSPAELDRFLNQQGLLHDPEATAEERISALPEHLRPT